MPTADRTTIKGATDALITSLRANLVANPPTVGAPFRSVVTGPIDGSEHPRPFLSVTLKRARPFALTDNDRMFELSLTLALFVDVNQDEAHPVMLDAIGAVEDQIDSIVDAGLIEGADGFEGRIWSFNYPNRTSGARMASASATDTIIVKVERGQNRIPTT